MSVTAEGYAVEHDALGRHNMNVVDPGQARRGTFTLCLTQRDMSTAPTSTVDLYADSTLNETATSRRRAARVSHPKR